MKQFTSLISIIFFLSACQPATTPAQEISMTAPAISVSISREDCTSVEIQAGTQVVWTNNDTVGLDIQLEKLDKNGNSSQISQSELGVGDSFSMQFFDSGTYRFYCTDEKSSFGTIIVQ